MPKGEVSLWIRVRDGFTAGFKRAASSVKAFGAKAGMAFRKIGKYAAGAGAAVTAFAGVVVAAFAKQQEAETKLAAALRATGQQVDSMLPMYKRLAASIQDATGIADEQTLANIALATQFGVTAAQMDQAIKLQIALNSVGVKGEAAMKVAANAVQGNTEMLNRYVPSIKLARTEAEKMAAINKFIATGLDVQQASLNTVAGRWNELKGRIGDALEAMGGGIAKGTGLQGVIAGISEKVKDATGKIQEWADSGGWDSLIQRVKELAAEFKKMAGQIADAVKATLQLFTLGGNFGDYRYRSERVQDREAREARELDQRNKKFVRQREAAEQAKAEEQIRIDIAKQAEEQKARDARASRMRTAKESITSFAKELFSKERLETAYLKIREQREMESSNRIAKAKEKADAAVLKLQERRDRALLIQRPENFNERLQGFIERREQAQQADRDNRKTLERIAKIRDKAARGVNLTASDKKFVENVRAFRQAEAEAKRAAKVQDDIRRSLQNIEAAQEANLKASGGP